VVQTHAAQDRLEAGIAAQLVEPRVDGQKAHPLIVLVDAALQQVERSTPFAEAEMNDRAVARADVAGHRTALDLR
jgi:hypothetical protein